MTTYGSSTTPNSRLGIASCVVAGLAMLAAVLMVYVTIEVYPEHGGGGDHERLRAGLRIADIAAFTAAGLSVVGVILGILGLTRSTGQKHLAVLGLVVNGLMAALLGFLIVVAVMAR